MLTAKKTRNCKSHMVDKFSIFETFFRYKNFYLKSKSQFLNIPLLEVLRDRNYFSIFYGAGSGSSTGYGSSSVFRPWK